MNKIGVECHYIDGCAVDKGFIYLACQLDDLDPQVYTHTRMSGYQSYAIGSTVAPNGWFYHDLESNIVSVCVKKATPAEGRRLCALSKEGEVEVYSAKTGPERVEKIPDAGIRLSQYKDGVTGYVSHIREIGSTLYVCGLNGQVYRRDAILDWQHHDAGVFAPMTAHKDAPTHNFTCIDGNHERDLYVVGDEGMGFHFDGAAWRRLTLPTDEHLMWVRCYGRDEVYICGANGVLLQGSAHKGFRDVSAVTDNFTWWCVTKFKDKVYLAAREGLFAWDGQRIAPVTTGLTPEIETWRVDTDGTALWSFGTKDLAWFDGSRWQRLHDPDNPRIGP